jgi:UDP-N-acetylmuramate: L-alanyl-gamma-D-glutamyl-meso-diaminopimelate ligase
MHAHLVGVSGAGMGSLAALLRDAGHEVSGSDIRFDPPMGPTLQAHGVTCLTGYDAKHLEPLPDLVVVGNAVGRANPEAEAAERLGVERISMSAALRRYFLARRNPLVVTGTHGKTTTSAMCAWLLEQAGLEPGWFIGGIPKGHGTGARIGSTRVRLARTLERRETAVDKPGQPRAPFVVEGDEYDDVYWQKKPKFLDYVGVSPDDVVVVTSIEHDHLDIYPDVASYEAAFRALLRQVPEGGLAVCNARDARVRAIASEASRARISWYALEHDDTGGLTPIWLGAPATATHDRAQTFDLFAGGVACGRFTLRVPGLHNVRNAIATIAACAEGFGVAVDEARAHLAKFEGVRRRQELIGKPAGVCVYDDFAHHPTAVRETLLALRSRHPSGTLWAVFEPRSATACRSVHQQAYVRAFDAADRVLLAPLARTNLPETDRLDLQRLALDIGPRASPMRGVDAIVARVADGARPGDVVVILSNGAFGGIQDKLLAALNRP